MLLEGSCPIVIAGLSEARKIFLGNPQLAHRSEKPINLDPLVPSNTEDMDLFWNFLSDYLVTMSEVGAATNCEWVLEGDNPACLLEVSGGVLGATCNLLKEAVQLASKDGRLHLERSDLERAADIAVLNGLHRRNPFRVGLASTSQRKVA